MVTLKLNHTEAEALRTALSVTMDFFREALECAADDETERKDRETIKALGDILGRIE